MFTKTNIASLLIAILLGTSACGIIRPPKLDFPPEYKVPKRVTTELATPLERARRATFTMNLPYYRVSGSAVIVGRERVSDHQFLYQALTAHHVLDDMAPPIENGEQGANRVLMVMLQPTLHGAPLRMQIRLATIEHKSADHDWILFTFYSKHYLEYVELATEQEFQSLQAFETIYAVGSDGAYGQLCRRGVLGATHNQHINLRSQTKLGRATWSKYPNAFFRPFIQAWYGTSGGGVFNQTGKLIGLINGGNIGGGQGVVSHSVVSTKAHLIRQQLDETIH